MINALFLKIKSSLPQQWQEAKSIALVGYALILNIFVIDVFSKFVMIDILRSVPQKSYDIVSGFLSFTQVWNFGVSFGMLSAQGLVGLWSLRVFTISILLFLFYLHLYAKSKLESLSLAVIIGGACGNIFDRFYHGAVYDFIDITLFGWHFWTFNIADIAITIGALGLVLSHFTMGNRLGNNNKES